MESSELHDYSTLRGKIALLYRRINWAWIIPISVIILVVYLLTLMSTRYQTAPSTNLTRTPSQGKLQLLQKGHYMFEAEGEIFPGLDSTINKTELIHLEIRQAIIDLHVLAVCLDGATNLLTLQISAQGLTPSRGIRVNLPKLQQFQFNYLPKINADEFKRADLLKDIMFFDKSTNTSWDFDQDILNLGIYIHIVIDGTTLLEVDRQVGLININLHFCSQILNFVRGEFTKLVLTWCEFSKISLVSPSLKYLNLNNAIPRSPSDLSTLIRSLTKLEELHLYQPFLGQDDEAPEYYWTPSSPTLQIPLDLTELSGSLKKLSVCRLSLLSTSTLVTSIEDLSLEETDVSPILVDNFQRTFPNLTTLRLFSRKDVKTSWSTQLLLKALQSPNVLKIVVTGFNRKGSDRESVEIDKILSEFGFGDAEPNFLVLRNGTGSDANVTARAMNYLETNYKRYESMGFEDVDTYEDYLLYDSADVVEAITSAGQTCLRIWVWSDISTSVLTLLLLFNLGIIPVYRW